MDKKLGMQKSPQDKRDFSYQNVAPFSKEALPSRHICRSVPVRDQGRLGFCVGVSTGTMKDNREVANAPGLGRDMSGLFIQYWCKQRDGIPHTEGTYPRVALDSLLKEGVCLENDFPYTKASFPVPKPGNEVIDKAKAFKANGYAGLHSVEEIKSALVNEGVAVFGIMVTSNFMTPEKRKNESSESFVKFPPEGYMLGGHAIAVIGYDDDMTYTYENGRICKGFFLLQNSWGENWGTDGKAWYPYEYLTHEVQDMPGFTFLMEAWTLYDKREPQPIKELKMWIDNCQALADGEPIELDQPPIIDEETWRTLVPLRQTCELFGLSVQWFPEDTRIEIDGRIKLWLDRNTAVVDGKTEKLDQPPYVDGKTWRTLIPVAFVMRTLGFDVQWHQQDRMVLIRRGK